MLKEQVVGNLIVEGKVSFTLGLNVVLTTKSDEGVRVNVILDYS